MTLESKVTRTGTPLVFYDRGASYFVQLLQIRIFCQRSRSNIHKNQMPTPLPFLMEDIHFLIAGIALETKFKVKKNVILCGI